MPTIPFSIRFDEPVLARLRVAARHRSSTPSTLAQRLVDEGLRTLEFSGIEFRDGPSGRRAGIVAGPDVWEIIAAILETSRHGQEPIVQVANDFELPVEKVQSALSYYGIYADEINQEIADNRRAAEQAFQSWLNQQSVLA